MTIYTQRNKENNYYHQKDEYYRKKEEEEDEEEIINENNYLKIWETQKPSYNDVNGSHVYLRVISLAIVLGIIGFGYYGFSENLQLTYLVVAVLGITFIVVFRDKIFLLQHFYSYYLRNFSEISMFEGMYFWFREHNDSTLFISNRTDRLHTAIKIFEIEVIPETVEATVAHFLRSLYAKRISLLQYQVVQLPNTRKHSNHSDMKGLIETSKDSKITKVYFTTSYRFSGSYSEKKDSYAVKEINRNEKLLSSVFGANFHHFKINVLRNRQIVDAVRTLIIGNPSGIPADNELQEEAKVRISMKTVVKIWFLFIIFVMVNISLSQFTLLFFWTITLNIAMVLLIIGGWWQDIFSFHFVNSITNTQNITFVNPFAKMRFYTFKSVPESLYIHYDNRILLNLKSVNLRYSFNTGSFVYPGKLFRSFTKEELPVIYNVTMSPIGFETFYEESKKLINKRTIQSFYHHVENQKKRNDWLNMRLGMWKMITTMTVSGIVYTSQISSSKAQELEDYSQEKIEALKEIFEMEFDEYHVVHLKRNRLLSAAEQMFLKTKLHRKSSHLSYLILQGKNMFNFIRIINELKKGVSTRVAAEFNTPLQLENDIVIGNNINTEFLKDEVYGGFLVNQLKELFILNGTLIERERVLMNIVAKMVEIQEPSIIFDFTGRWSALIKHFEESQYEDDFLTFKLGHTFNLQLFHSGIPHDKHNLDYLSYLFDAFAMVYKKDNREIQMLKKQLLESHEIDPTKLALKYDEDMKRSYSESTIATLNEFITNSVAESSLISDDDRIGIMDFLDNDKTVIIDLTEMVDIKDKLFATMIIMCKIIHYVNHTNHFFSKTMILEYADIIFDEKYLERYSDQAKIDKFLIPLKISGFGTIFCANQITHLQEGLLKHFNNFLTLQARDKNDVYRTRDIMGLQELHAGYYSHSRKNSYQLDYLKQLPSDEVIIRRDDIFQPFPLRIDSEFDEYNIMRNDEIFRYMKKQGYDMEFREKKLIAMAKKTIFEKDLGKYFEYIEEIIKFLTSIRKLDKLGNIYKRNLLEALKKAIYKKARARTNNHKPKIAKIRNDIFEKLIDHAYLIESHPETAGGNHSIRSTYAVGPQYELAIEDFYNTKKEAAETRMEVLQRESEENRPALSKEEVKAQELKDQIDEMKFRQKLISETGKNLFAKLYQFKKRKAENDYQGALKLAEQYVPNFLMSLYKEFFDFDTKKGEFSQEDIDFIIEYLTKNKKVPFSKEQIYKLIEETKFEALKDQDVDERMSSLHSLMLDFSTKIHNKLLQSPPPIQKPVVQEAEFIEERENNKRYTYDYEDKEVESEYKEKQEIM